MKFDFGKLVQQLLEKARIVKKDSGPIPEVDLEAPMMLPKACLVRALVDRMTPGQQIIFRCADLNIAWEMEHFCNHLGHELLKVEKEGSTFFFTLRVRGDIDRLPKQDPFKLDLSPQTVIQTIDITPNREPWRLSDDRWSLAKPKQTLKAKND